MDDTPFFLGLPLMNGDICLGTLVFIRKGGPNFSGEDVHFSEFIANQITILLYRQIMQLEQNLLETQRKQAKLQEDFISNITHDLRNPLGCIKGYTTTLLRSDINWDIQTQHEFLQVIDQETDRLQEMINNLLDSARLQTGNLDMNFQLLRMDALISDVLTKAQITYTDLQFHLEMQKSLPPIIGDPNRLKQVLENIINNANKHAPNSNIWITIVQKEQSGIQIDIRDDGPGIAENYQSKIFDRFYRVPEIAPNIHGSGLGLFICKQILQAHRGEISVKSKLGTGTTFQIFIPFKQ